MSNSVTVLYDDEHVRVIYRPGSSSFTLATFSNFGFYPNRADFWGQQFCEKEDLAAIGFVAKSNNWFPMASMQQAVNVATTLNLPNIITYGHSQGGYAALKYSAALHAVGVLACAPQYSIDPSVTPRDTRFTSNFHHTLNRNMEITSADLSGNLIAVLDPADHADSYQISLIKQACPDNLIRIIPAYHLGHQIMDLMREREISLSLLKSCQTDMVSDSLLHAISTYRKRSWSYAINLAERLLPKRPRVAVDVLNKFLKQSNDRVPPEVHQRFSRVASAVYFQANCVKDILPVLSTICVANPDNRQIQASYAACASTFTASHPVAIQTITPKSRSGVANVPDRGRAMYKPYGNGVEISLTRRFIEYLHDSRIFSHQNYDVRRWQPGQPMRFLRTTELESYSAVYRGDIMNSLGAYSFMTLPVSGAYDMQFSAGRYCSIGGGLTIVGNAHPISTLSSSPIFYEKTPSWVKAAYDDGRIDGGPFVRRHAAKGCPVVGHDVWFGSNVTLNQAVKIGNGAVVAANAHVTKDVPDYAIVGGNPARLIRYRFQDEIISELRDIAFWRFSMPDLKEFDMENIETFIHEFRAAERQLTPWTPLKVNLWDAWQAIESN